MSFQETLQRLRKARDFKSARSFASAINVPYTTYVNYERIEGREPSFDVLCRMADVLGVSTDELLEHSWNESDEMFSMLKAKGRNIQQTADNVLLVDGHAINQGVLLNIFRKLTTNEKEVMRQNVAELLNNILESLFILASLGEQYREYEKNIGGAVDKAFPGFTEEKKRELAQNLIDVQMPTIAKLYAESIPKKYRPLLKELIDKLTHKGGVE